MVRIASEAPGGGNDIARNFTRSTAPPQRSNSRAEGALIAASVSRCPESRHPVGSQPPRRTNSRRFPARRDRGDWKRRESLADLNSPTEIQTLAPLTPSAFRDLRKIRAMQGLTCKFP